jgi:hypothetical protein
MSSRLTWQPPNPDRASDRPMGTNPNRAREQPMRNGPVARLGGIHVAERDTRHGSRHDRRGGPTSHATLFRTPPPPPIKGRMARGLRNASSAVDLGKWTLAIQICSLLTLMCIRAPT